VAGPSNARVDGEFAMHVANTNHRTVPADFDLLVDTVLGLGRELRPLRTFLQSASPSRAELLSSSPSWRYLTRHASADARKRNKDEEGGMRARGWLRAASVCLWFFTLGHTAGAFFSKSSGPQEDAVVQALKDFHFDAMGRDRTLWHFWEGFNVFTSLALATLAVLVWQLGRLSRDEPRAARPLVATLLVGMAAIAVLCWIDFFVAPAAASSLAAASLLMAWLSLRRPAGT
jgi:hypothetical protein